MSTARLLEPYTFFVDRSLGSVEVVEALREAGEIVIAHDEHFDLDTDDLEWLESAGAHSWVVLTKDARIRVNAVERNALLDACVAAFMLARGDLNGAQMGSAFVSALARIKRVLRRFPPPMIASVSAGGGVTVLYDRQGRLERPRPIK